MGDIPAVLLGSIERAPWGWVLMLAVVGALIKVWPILQLQAMNAAVQLRGETRDELHDCHARLDEMSAKFTALSAHVHALDMKLFGTVAAYRIIHDGLAANDPDNAFLAQGRLMFQTTWDGPIEAFGMQGE